jgi:peptide/nickel transport system ATP-binding protein
MNKHNNSVLKIDNLEIIYTVKNNKIPVVRDVSFDIKAGETFGLVGESGSGKSTLAYSIVQYLASNGKISKGQILFNGSDLTKYTQKELLTIRGSQIALVPQDPLTSLNPSHKVGNQIAEILRIHTTLNEKEIKNRVIELFDEVHIPMPETTVDKYPHQISGGQQQRILIAMAFCTNPKLLIMDEPTTGLDVTTQDRILSLINEMKKAHNTAVLYITHDMGVVKNLCDKVAILYAGEIVAQGLVQDLFNSPIHPYTKSLLDCIPLTFTPDSTNNEKLETIKGDLPNLMTLTSSCIFAPRCKYSEPKCFEEIPPLIKISSDRSVKCFFDKFPELEKEILCTENKINLSDDWILSIQNLKKFFPTPAGNARAIDNISFNCRKGEILGIAGESGCGKTTIARCIVGLTEKSDGDIIFKGENLSSAGKRKKELSQKIQMVFQNPESTLNPQKTVEQIIQRPLVLYSIGQKEHRKKRVAELLKMVKLNERYLSRYPHEISGGEKQRVGIARAFASNPELIVLDEPISSLDVSVQAGVLNLLHELQQKHGTTYIFIGHNLSVMRHLCNRIMVIYLGQICEIGTPKEIFSAPYHPYVEGLLSAIPVIESNLTQKDVIIDGVIPSVIEPIVGCPFYTRCHKKVGKICEEKKPPSITFNKEHIIYCHIPKEELEATDEIFGIKS